MIHFCDIISFIPPFTSVSDTKESFKGQVDPPCCGDGLSHNLILDILPSPHDAEHVLQWLHVPQLPSTAKESYEGLHGRPHSKLNYPVKSFTIMKGNGKLDGLSYV